ncbi:MAG: TlpA family protein disulfide reductase [Lachnospiraceae bacterium]|nr:TlpA family protein disulfide reductase [Lachnospiraceae bacterium]
MKKENSGKKYILLLVVLIVVLAAGNGAYRYLSKRYVPDSASMGNTAKETVAAESEKMGNTDLAEAETEPVNTETSHLEEEDGSEADENTAATESVTEEDAVDLAPDFVVYNREGAEVRLSDYIGKPVMVNFWATWCGPCQSELPVFDTAYQEYGEEIEFLMIDLTDSVSETKEVVEQFVAERGYSFPILFDSEHNAEMTYGVYAIPATIAVHADGTIAQAQVGALTDHVLQVMIDSIRE